jgi:sugar lactone lactonase YvrE
MRQLASGYQALEGATLDERASLLFSDLRGGGVHRLGSDGAAHVVVPERKAVGGICLHADGGLVLSGHDLCHFRKDTRRVLLDLDDLAARPGTTAVGFNDIAADPAGRVLAGVLRTDAAGQRTPGELVLVTGEHEHVVLHDDVHPNGIGLSPDRSRIYLSDTFGERLLVFSRHAGETPAPIGEISTSAVDGRPDGLAVDAEGCVWVAFYRGSCVARFAADGTLVRRVPVPALKPLSVCLTEPPAVPALYIVTGTREPGSLETGSVYRMPVDVGADPPDRAQI